jgi:two-component system cell cycle sensor histidine kinase/response regulator CckA
MQTKILLLEDNPNDAELIESELENAGMSFISHRVDSKEEFVDALDSFRPDVVLSDFSMPSFDGMTALSITRSQYPEMPFIFISGTIGEEKAIEALKNGATDYVLKDHPARLVPSVQRALREAGERAERKRAEMAQRDSQELFRLITENVADLIAVVDLDGKRLYNNAAYREILGDPETLRGTDSFQDIHPEDRDRIKALFLDTVRTGIGHRAEFRFIAKDQSVRYIESRGSVIRDSEGKVSRVVVLSRDVTERKKSELEKENLEVQFRQAQKMESIGTLAGGVAHDFNNILAIILGYGSLLEKNQPAPGELTKALANITQAARRGSAVVRQLMTFARKSNVVFAPTHVNTLIQELAGMVEATFPKTITLSTRLAADLPVITADAGQLNQALLNLCVNARDAMPEGGTIAITTEKVNADSIRARFREAEKVAHIAIHVSDTGCGMDDATRQRIFEPFFTTKQLGKGTGLGLAMVYGVVKGHKGHIDVESTPDKGTTFHVFLPVKESPARVEQPSTSAEQSLRVGGTVLLVEDEEMLIELVRSLLMDEGFSVLVARTGREAVETYRHHLGEVALVISDLGLPELVGVEVYKKIKEIDPTVKTIFTTGYLEEEVREDIDRMGDVLVIPKPFLPREFLRMVKAVITSPSNLPNDMSR